MVPPTVAVIDSDALRWLLWGARPKANHLLRAPTQRRGPVSASRPSEATTRIRDQVFDTELSEQTGGKWECNFLLQETETRTMISSCVPVELCVCWAVARDIRLAGSNPAANHQPAQGLHLAG